MCGRFAQKLPSSMLVDMYRTRPFMPNAAPNFNVAPTQNVMVIRTDTDKKERELALLKWGLVNSWSKTGRMEFNSINAKWETAATSAAFGSAFKSRRCIIPADAFYEWKKLGPGPKPPKQPYAIGRADGAPLSLAGLWEAWKQPDGEWLKTFTILTIKPNELMADIHTRMPVIFGAEDIPVWLGEVPGDVAALRPQCPAEWLKVWKVSPRVGNVKNNDEALLEEIET